MTGERRFVLVERRLKVDEEVLQDFCERWKIKELRLFGSALRDDFGEGSDIDLLVAFEQEARWSLFDHVEMEDELARILDRDVDLVTLRSIERSENPLRRDSILNSAEQVYAAG